MHLSLTLFLAGCTLPELKPPGGDDSAVDSGAEDGATDHDDDGYAADDDCDDENAGVNPGVASDGCNAIDDDCDGDVDEDPNVSWYPDEDGDGYGNQTATASVSCSRPGGTVSNHTDCHDGDVHTWPGAPEMCDAVDNDCDGTVDEDINSDLPWYYDRDGDGTGDPNRVTTNCAQPDGYVDNAYDCNDADVNEPVWVDDVGSGGSGSFAEPYASIQVAIDTGRACVYVHGGAYYENVDFRGLSPNLLGIDGSANTTVYGDGTSSVFLMLSNESPTVQGFTVSGGGGYKSAYDYDGGDGYHYYVENYFGGGVLIEGGSPTLTDVVAYNNQLPDSSYLIRGTDVTQIGSYGGGIFSENGYPTFYGVKVYDNNAYQGGGLVQWYGGLTAYNLEVSGNTGQTQAGIDIQYAAFTATALLLNANHADYGYGGIYAIGSTVKLMNATIVVLDYGIGLSSSVLEIDSSILQNNSYGVYADGSSTATAMFTDVYSSTANWKGIADPTGVDGNQAVNAQFKTLRSDDDRTNDNLELSTKSTLIDAGNPDPSNNDKDGSVNDCGYYGGPYAP